MGKKKCHCKKCNQKKNKEYVSKQLIPIGFPCNYGEDNTCAGSPSACAYIKGNNSKGTCCWRGDILCPNDSYYRCKMLTGDPCDRNCQCPNSDGTYGGWGANGFCNNGTCCYSVSTGGDRANFVCSR